MEYENFVIQFEQLEDPTKEELVNAYTLRDDYYNENNADTRYNYLKKLGYTLESAENILSSNSEKYTLNYIKNKYNIKNLDLTLNEFQNVITQYKNSEEYIKAINDYNIKKERILELRAINSNNELFNKLTKGELIYLGW